MTEKGNVSILLGRYTHDRAGVDAYLTVRALQRAGDLSYCDAAVVTRDETGKVLVDKDETSTRHGFWGGLVAGAAVGLLFPPALLATALVGAAAGGVGEHLSNGLSKADVSELAEFVGPGQACLLVVAASADLATLEERGLGAEAQIVRELDLEVEEFDVTVRSAAEALGAR